MAELALEQEEDSIISGCESFSGSSSSFESSNKFDNNLINCNSTDN